MPRRKTASSANISIRGDEQEQHRIQLEHNLLHTDLSFHLSSPDVDDVEFPRHNSGPDHLNGFTSFDPPDADHFDPDDHSQFNAWSYRTVDDDEGIDPYAGQTVSTAAHHASALTLSAGLGRGGRRDVSMSGAEYDPDRPLQNIMAGITSRINAFNMDDTKSKNLPSVDFDPLVVDDSAELVGIPQRKLARVPAGIRSPSSTSSSSRPATPLSPRPTLTDALSSVAFSPKRPRNEPVGKQTTVPARVARHASRSRPSGANREENVSTMRTHSKATSSYPAFPQQSLSYATAIEPEVNIEPPTPSVVEQPLYSSKTARTTTREPEVETTRPRRYAENPAVVQNYKRRPSGKPAVESVPREARATHPRISSLRTPYRDRIHLPDVTGLTSAIESPARVALDYMGYDAQDDAEINARLTATLGIVQAKLSNLEAQNSISRRRVRELEVELEQCKHDVNRERNRAYDREHIISQQRADAKAQKQKLADTARLVEERASGAGDQSRYKEVVEEQKALQALVMTLKGHLTRLTSELSDHHRLLEELRSVRDTDVRALKDKSRDVDNLRQEVERLGGEVEVLRGVVEEGLKQRREVREASIEQNHADAPFAPEESFDTEQQRAAREPSDDTSVCDDGDSSPAHSPTPSPQKRANRTLRTDQATLGSPPVVEDASGPGFLDSMEIERISEEVSERRVERSASNSTLSHRSHSPLSFHQVSPVPSLVYSRNRQDKQSGQSGRQTAVVEDQAGVLRPTSRGPSPTAYRGPQTEAHIPTQEPRATSSRTAAAATHDRPPSRANLRPSQPCEDTELPFPRIRGAYLERLFFSAPEHHANTCTVCNRRQRRRAQNQWGGDVADRRDLRERLRDAEQVEGAERGREPRGVSAKGKERVEADERVPPQTVLARVLRELEDDFAHYREIYIELADQYKDIDPVVNVAKRNVLAEHLREVIDILEQKGDQIASLYDLLTFSDKPAAESDGHKAQKPRAPREAEFTAAS